MNREENADEPTTDGDARATEAGRREAADKELQLAYERFASTPEYLEKLRRGGTSFRNATQFAVGDLVQWKPLMQLYVMPAMNRPGIVVPPPTRRDETLDPDGVLDPGIPKESRLVLSGNDDALYEDIFVGVLDIERTFRVFKLPSRRLEHWTPGDAD
ncbi:MAG: hypothetical protein LBK59_07035 [Bifidobacteriaceae bacterium]|jgi:hypothetical protein|nr:hypothetical protein [Bifidobacteriaceae bacterium]